MDDIKLSVVIPCYNEAKNISVLLSALDAVIKRSDIEVLLVNNGSQDNSGEIFRELLPNYPFAREIEVKQNIGYGNGILQGLRASKGELLAWTHADLQTPPSDIITALELIEQNHDGFTYFVKGDRQKRPLMDQFFTWGMSLFETLLLGHRLWDINAQPNMFHRSFFNKWQEMAPTDFSFDLYVFYCAKKQGLRIIRFPVFFPERIHGQSSWNTGFSAKLKFIKRTLVFSFKLRRQLP